MYLFAPGGLRFPSFILLPVILPVDSPWPRLLCSRKKSLLLSVTQSFRAFFNRTSSGFSHIIVGPAEVGAGGVSPSQLPRRWESVILVVSVFVSAGSSGSGAARSLLQRRHVDPALPTAAGLRAHTHTHFLAQSVRPLTPDLQQLYTLCKDPLSEQILTRDRKRWGVACSKAVSVFVGFFFPTDVFVYVF